MTVEVGWFSALCDDDYEFLGVPDPALRSSWEHCRNLVLTTHRHGSDNILLPSGYGLGIEAFILSGYPHMSECDLFARHVLPRLDHGPLRDAAPRAASHG